MVAQHRAVNAVLEAEIGKMHGLTLKTMATSKWRAAQGAGGAAA
jgi:stress-induced morphogen